METNLPTGESSKARAPRRDAQARREALIVAAAECFFEQGYRVPLEEVADRAGVGRATLYRNFKDREALALAIFEREIARMGAAIDPRAPLDQTMIDLVRSGAKASALFVRIASELKLDRENVAAFEALGGKLSAMLAPVAAAAKARGELRLDITPEQLVVALRMIGGLHKLHIGTIEADDVVIGALDMLLRGLRPR